MLFPEQSNKESYDEDPTWTPEEIDRAYETLKEDDDSVQTNANPRYVKKSCDFLVKKCNNLIALCPLTYTVVACYYFSGMNIR